MNNLGRRSRILSRFESLKHLRKLTRLRTLLNRAIRPQALRFRSRDHCRHWCFWFGGLSSGFYIRLECTKEHPCSAERFSLSGRFRSGIWIALCHKGVASSVVSTALCEDYTHSTLT